MRTLPRPAFALLLAILVSGADPARPASAPVPLGEVAARATVPPGFTVTLAAGEPQVVQPIAMTTDDRGRLWVVECLSYPEWSSTRPGRDRVIVLEDTDADGVFDKRTVFLDGGKNLSSVELGHGGVWLCSLPELVFVPCDFNADTPKPSGPARVVLDGWSLECKHNVVNGLIWGPDGWLWGLNGIITTSHVGKPGTPEEARTPINCGVWRVHPTTHAFEVICTGTTNPFGLDFDDYGQGFFTNCVIDHLWQAVPGAHYERMYGAEFDPATFEPMRSTSDHKHWAGGHWTASRTAAGGHSDAGGGHAHSGCLIYLGGQFPPEYRNSVLMGNIHGNRLNRDQLVRNPAGYVGARAPDFFFANDPWFRPVAIKPAHDGAIYVSDWSDTGECHNYETVDRTNGRIVRIGYGKAVGPAVDLSKLSDLGLAEKQSSANEWEVRHARRLLAERSRGRALDPAALLRLREMLALADVARQLRAAWALSGCGKLAEADVAALAYSAQPELRVWAARLLAESPGADGLVTLARMASSETSPEVRAHLASAATRLPVPAARAMLPGLLGNAEDELDWNRTRLVWSACAPVFRAAPGEALALAAGGKLPTARRLAARLALLNRADPTDALAGVLAEVAGTADESKRLDFLKGVREGLADRARVAPPSNWARLAPRLVGASDPELRAVAESLALQFGDPAAVIRLSTRAADPARPAAERVAAVEQLAARQVPGLAPKWRELLADPAVRGAALRALARDADDATATAILAAFPGLNPAERADAIQTLTGRAPFAAKLLDAVGAGAVPKGELTAFTARQITALKRPELDKRLSQVWGDLKPASATRAAQQTRLKAYLTADTLKAADTVNGGKLFTASCAACHKLFGQGGDVGPELTGSQRANVDYLLENVLDPNAVVPFDYKMTAFYLADGRVVTGLVKAESAQAVTVRTANSLEVIPKGDIEERKKTDNSVMPEGLLDPLTDAQIRDLVAYLALPAAP